MKWKNDKLILERGETIRIFGRDKAKKGDLEATERIALPDYRRLRREYLKPRRR